jgi:hypothetical protein
MELIVAKSRETATGVVPLMFYGATLTFVEAV